MSIIHFWQKIQPQVNIVKYSGYYVIERKILFFKQYCDRYDWWNSENISFAERFATVEEAEKFWEERFHKGSLTLKQKPIEFVKKLF